MAEVGAGHAVSSARLVAGARRTADLRGGDCDDAQDGGMSRNGRYGTYCRAPSAGLACEIGLRPAAAGDAPPSARIRAGSAQASAQVTSHAHRWRPARYPRSGRAERLPRGPGCQCREGMPADPGAGRTWPGSRLPQAQSAARPSDAHRSRAPAGPGPSPRARMRRRPDTPGGLGVTEQQGLGRHHEVLR